MIIMKIRKKTFLLFFSCIFVFVIFGIMSNYLFLEKFYIYKTKQKFITLSREIQKNIEVNGKNIEKYIIKVGKRENVRIVILDSKWKVQQISYYKRKDKSNIPFNKIKKMEKQRKKKKYICEIFEIKNDSVSKIIFLGKTKNNQYLVLMKNTNGVKESVVIANQFYFVVGCIMLFISLIFTSFFSRKITSPIIKMSKITKELENMNFDNKIDVKTKDEIGELAISINHMAEQLQKDIYMMQRDIERRKQLVRDVSHELKSPIAVIKGYSDGLRYGVAEDESTKEKYCNIIGKECERMDQMVKELLELSRLEQIKIDLVKEYINLYSIIEQIEEKYSKQIQDKECSINVDCNGGIVIAADKRMLEHILSNLFGNAIKYVKKCGNINISVREEKDEIRVEIFNSGDNIPSEEIEKIWDVFYKVDKSRKREDAGHGLGLAIVKTAVELQGGNVFFENKVDGVVFGFFIPKTSH